MCTCFGYLLPVYDQGLKNSSTQTLSYVTVIKAEDTHWDPWKYTQSRCGFQSSLNRHIVGPFSHRRGFISIKPFFNNFSTLTIMLTDMESIHSFAFRPVSKPWMDSFLLDPTPRMPSKENLNAIFWGNNNDRIPDGCSHCPMECFNFIPDGFSGGLGIPKIVDQLQALVLPILMVFFCWPGILCSTCLSEIKHPEYCYVLRFKPTNVAEKTATFEDRRYILTSQSKSFGNQTTSFSCSQIQKSWEAYL